ncbi:hypothetical protein ACTHAM_002175 [Cellulomonas soli]|uniref:hypothetical protein n=1 Tax=Cellulomonas soli TaxID=931535 RepID=UPI003F875916
MSSTKSSNHRKALAVGLAVVGVAGLSLASAAQLNFAAPQAQFQAGVDTVASCQSATVDSSFGTPVLTGGAYVTDSVTLANIDALCAGKSYKVSLLDATGAVVGAEKSGTVAGTSIAVTGLSVTDVDAVAKIALTIYS